MCGKSHRQEPPKKKSQIGATFIIVEKLHEWPCQAVGTAGVSLTFFNAANNKTSGGGGATTSK